MKKILSPLFPFRFAALSAALALAPLFAAEKSKAGDDTAAREHFHLSFSKDVSPEMNFAVERMKLIEQKYKAGQATQEEVLAARTSLEELERHASYRITIRSSGGPLRELLAATSKSDDVSLTVINAGDPADLETLLPPFNLRNAHWGIVVEVLANFLATRDLQLKLAGSDNPDPAQSKSIVCVLRRVGPGPEAKEAPPVFDSFPLAPYLTAYSIDDIVSTIRAGWELDPKHDRDALRLKFHPATSILLVSGPPEAIMVAGKVVSQLKPGPKETPKR